MLPVVQSNHGKDDAYSLMDSLTPTKILAPRRPAHLLTRERLLDLLYDLLDYRLIIIAAPAGYGKTSLLVDLAHHVDMPVCWYTLDPLDQDPRRFVTYFVASLAHRFPDFAQQSWAALQDQVSTVSNFDHLASMVTGHVFERIREHFVIVVDDYHLGGNAADINCFINRFVQQVDENCHLILSSRALLSLSDLPLMVARSQVGGLAFGDLAFRADEIQSLILQNYHLTIPLPEAERLAQETEGWITGLLLSAQTMWQGMADRVRLARASGVGLYDYLAQQVLDQQPEHTRDFLLRTSFLEEFDAELCEAVLGPQQDCRALLEAVLRDNLFVLPLESGGTWLRYHHLFRDFLQARLAQERPEERERILRRLATVYAERQEWDKAHQACQRLGDVAATADLIERAGEPMVKSGRWAALAGWIDALPFELLASRPGLLSRRGIVAVVLGEPRRGLELLDQAEAAFRASGNKLRLAGVLVWRATAHRYCANYHASLADADEALALAKEENSRPTQAEALRVRGLGLHPLGRLREAITCLEQSRAIYGEWDAEQDLALINVDLGMAFRASGEYEQAESAYASALEYWRRVGDAARQASVLNNLGVLNHFKGSYERAISYLDEALACARRSGFARMEALVLASFGDLYAELGIPEAAQDAYRQARHLARRIDERFLLLYLDLADAALASLRADWAGAHYSLGSATQLAQAGNSDYERGLCCLAAGRAALAEGDAAQAAACFEKAAGCFTGEQQIEACRAQLFWAAACQANNDRAGALAHLARAFHLAGRLDSQHALVVSGCETKALLEAARADAATGQRASRLLAQIADFEQERPALRRRVCRLASAVSVPPPRLTFQALGGAQVKVDGKPVTGAEWQALVARDLVFCLLAHPDGLAREAIGVLFWPDNSPAQLRLQLKKTVYRLRRALSQDIVLFDQERYRFNRGLDYEYDVSAFLETLTRGRAAPHRGERAAAYGEAVALYQGHYLPDVDRPWVSPERERLWQMYVEAVLALVEFHLQAKEYDAALACCQRALAQDACLEAVHCLMMRAYAAMGNQAAVARQFEHCRQALLQELDVSPSSQTRLLYKNLTH